MKRTRFMVAASLALAAALALSGCSSAPAPASASSPASAPASTPEGEKTLVYWAQWSENEDGVDVLKDAISRFEANNPGYKVQVNWAGAMFATS